MERASQCELSVNRDDVEQRSEAVDVLDGDAGVGREVVSIARRDAGKRDDELPPHGVETRTR